ncbi:MAG: hypothetical protein LKE74_04795 [Prevotella sp.]|jgi:hypothetical protein|nr:hypothetical protein [Prevotella sp.]MCH4017758.1 hypothetical protein [Prevotella sp.]
MSRILFLLSCYSGVGGIEKVTNYLANEFCKVHSVIIASQMRIENKPMLDALDKRVKFFKLPDEKNPLAMQ